MAEDSSESEVLSWLKCPEWIMVYCVVRDSRRSANSRETEKDFSFDRRHEVRNFGEVFKKGWIMNASSERTDHLIRWFGLNQANHWHFRSRNRDHVSFRLMHAGAPALRNRGEEIERDALRERLPTNLNLDAFFKLPLSLSLPISFPGNRKDKRLFWKEARKIKKRKSKRNLNFGF